MTLQTARSQGQEAGQRALDRAERACPGWAEKAYGYLGLFASRMSRAPYLQPWTTEEFRNWAHSNGLPLPTDNRAIGGVIAKAIREELIAPCGFAPTVSSHGSPRRTYRRAV